MEFIRNIFLVGKKSKTGAARWITSFSMMALILASIYLQKPDTHSSYDNVLQHDQENDTFSRASCKVEAIGKLELPNLLLSDDETFGLYARCLGKKMNKKQDKFTIHQVVGVFFKKDRHFYPNLVLYVELHTTAFNITRQDVETALKREIQSNASTKCNEIFEVNRQKCNFYS